MNREFLNGNQLCVGIAQNKVDRQSEFKHQFEQIKQGELTWFFMWKILKLVLMKNDWEENSLTLGQSLVPGSWWKQAPAKTLTSFPIHLLKSHQGNERQDCSHQTTVCGLQKARRSARLSSPRTLWTEWLRETEVIIYSTPTRQQQHQVSPCWSFLSLEVEVHIFASLQSGPSLTHIRIYVTLTTAQQQILSHCPAPSDHRRFQKSSQPIRSRIHQLRPWLFTSNFCCRTTRK